MSIQQNDKQTCILINKCKIGDKRYYKTFMRKKVFFWKEIVNTINQIYNTNYFTSKKYNKKFLVLT